MPHKVLIVDDHALFRRGLAHLIAAQPDMSVCGEASNGAEAVEMTLRYRPDVILMDVHMPVLDGIAATRQILQQLPEARVVMLTVSDDDETVFEAVKAGAKGYLLKDLEPEELYAYLRSVFRGETPLSGSLATRILRELQGGTPPRGENWKAAQGGVGAQPLTERERQVLELVGRGMTNREIASTLYISENTVKIHMKHILEKLHAANRAQAATLAVSEGLIAADSDREGGGRPDADRGSEPRKTGRP